jgi:hypothetical protein
MIRSVWRRSQQTEQGRQVKCIPSNLATSTLTTAAEINPDLPFSRLGFLCRSTSSQPPVCRGISNTQFAPLLLAEASLLCPGRHHEPQHMSLATAMAICSRRQHDTTQPACVVYGGKASKLQSWSAARRGGQHLLPGLHLRRRTASSRSRAFGPLPPATRLCRLFASASRGATSHAGR